MVRFADKAAMRDHVAETVGAAHLPELVAILDDPAKLLGLALPDEYVLKPTHGSGACVIVSPHAPADARLPSPREAWRYTLVRPEHAEPRALQALASSWAEVRWGRGPNHEWAYQQIRPRLLVEALLQGPNGELPDDYKVFVFHQHARYIQVDGGRFGQPSRDFFDRHWQNLPLTGGRPRTTPHPPEPEQLPAILDLAARLGAGTDFVRVDLYVLADRVVVGELSTSPAGGDSPFDPPEWNERFGASWHVPRRYVVTPELGTAGRARDGHDVAAALTTARMTRSEQSAKLVP